MALAETISIGGARVRIRPWRGRSDVAELTTVPPGAIVTPAVVRAALDRCRAHGFTTAVTPALPTIEGRPFLDCGFELQERLHLLSHTLHGLPDRPDHRLRRALKRDHDDVLLVDGLAFQPFWRLDQTALDDAIAATPSTRFRVNRNGAILGYAICGRSGTRGYVQRLAVDPEVQGRGLGSGLLLDGLHWLKRWRCVEALVNTQISNERAVELYERHGFRRRTDGLAVFRRDLTTP